MALRATSLFFSFACFLLIATKVTSFPFEEEKIYASKDPVYAPSKAPAHAPPAHVPAHAPPKANYSQPPTKAHGPAHSPIKAPTHYTPSPVARAPTAPSHLGFCVPKCQDRCKLIHRKIRNCVRICSQCCEENNMCVPPGPNYGSESKHCPNWKNTIYHGLPTNCP